MKKMIRHKKDFKPGELIKKHQEMVAKGKVPKHGLAEEKAELKLLKKAAKKK